MKITLEKRARALAACRAALEARGFLEVDPPALVPAPGMEPHIDAFELRSVEGRRLYLHTSPEYAMKRLLAAGLPRIYSLGHVYRDEPASVTHSPEFTMLEMYCPGGEREIMAELEGVIAAVAEVLGRPLELPFERRSVREVFREYTGVDIAGFLPASEHRDAFAAALEAAGALRAAGPEDGWDELFFRAFLDHVEPKLGQGRALYLTDYPAHMAALSKLRTDDPAFARRFELYLDGVELANGFAELDDEAEQRARLVAEQEERRAAGRPVYPLDEPFLEAVGRLPETGGVALGFDRLLMLLTGAESIAEVLPLPFADYAFPGED
ncbi:MAG: EF-P lysine aminoacylase EpmA [Deltaproteobacteria bacterium]|nr:EF-P lysine aminoacylase EpmA [Deltaproteobacteria bacterium]